MPLLLVPYHQDDRLPADDLPVREHHDARWVTPTAGMTALHREVADRVAEHVAAGTTPLVLSGDCLVALGTLAGVQRAGHAPAVVWFDAHGDLHTEETSTSGYAGGMALRLALGAHREQWADPLDLRPLPADRAVLVDGRDLDPPEVAFLATGGVARHGVEALNADVLPTGPLVLHVDLDVIDPAELPGLRFPAPGGPDANAVLAAARRVLDTGRVVAIDVAAPWHPARDDEERAIRADLLDRVIALAG